MSETTTPSPAAPTAGEASAGADAAGVGGEAIEAKTADTQEAQTESTQKEEGGQEVEKKEGKELEVKSEEKKEEGEKDVAAKLEEAEKKLQEAEEKLESNLKTNNRLVELFDENPELPEMISYVDKGASFREAIARVLDVESLTPVEGDPDYEAWRKAKKDRKDRLEKRETELKQLDENIKMSKKEIDEFVKENNLKEDKAKALLGTLDEMLAQVYDGKVDKKFLNLLKKATDFDKEVDTARKQGEVKAKNEKIEAKKVEKKGDAIPDVEGGGEEKEPEKLKMPKIFESIDKFNKNQQF